MTSEESPFRKIAADLRHYAAQERLPLTAGFAARMFLLTPGFQFVFCRRLQEIVVRIPLVGRLLRRILWWFTSVFYGSEIGLAATVGGGLYIPHPYGIVIGICSVGRNVAIMQNVTIGRRNPLDDGAARIGDGVLLSAGCVVLGGITIGENAIAGANSVVLTDVPAGASAVGIPAKVLTPKVRLPEDSAAPDRSASIS